MSNPVLLDSPNVGCLEKSYLNKALDSGYISTAGPFVPLFEKTFAGYLGVKNAVATQSGTASLHMALYELGIGKGDEVIVPALTFIATANPVLYVRARPVFADVELSTWNISPEQIERKITKRTKAIIPVHLYGNPCDMRTIMGISKKHGLYVIEDATESLGGSYQMRQSGTFGDFGCFSFNGNKIISTGGGGMIVGKSAGRLRHIKYLVNQARDDSEAYCHSEVGFNYRMTNLESAMGLAQLGRLKEFLAKKRRMHLIYRQELGNSGSVIFQQEYPEARSSWWMNCFLLNNPLDPARMQKQLKKRGVPSRRLFMPLTSCKPFRCGRMNDYPNSYSLYERGLCLPSSTLNTEEGIRRVCSVIKELQ